MVVRIFKNLNDPTDNVVKISDTAGKTPIYVTKVTGITVGTFGVIKRTLDTLEAIACQDGVCAIVNGVGVCADTISIATSFIPGPNITTLITILLSVGCKVFVYWSKKAKKIPWGANF